MSFSGDTRRELLAVSGSSRASIEAEAYGMLASCPHPAEDEEGRALLLTSENEAVARKFFTLIRKAYKIEQGVFLTEEPHGARSEWKVALTRDLSDEILKKLARSAKEGAERHFLRGAYIGGGSISDPNRYYHLEIVCQREDAAKLVLTAMRGSGLDAKYVIRKKYHVVYLKEGDQIVTALGLMGAGRALMALENIRILRGVRGNENRRVNCEVANSYKQVETSVRQIEDIEYIRDHMGFGALTPPLREMAEVRLMHEEASLGELGSYLEGKIGKSGVNHRLKRLSAIAEELRRKEAERKASEEESL